MDRGTGGGAWKLDDGGDVWKWEGDDWRWEACVWRARLLDCANRGSNKIIFYF